MKHNNLHLYRGESRPSPTASRNSVNPAMGRSRPPFSAVIARYTLFTCIEPGGLGLGGPRSWATALYVPESYVRMSLCLCLWGEYVARGLVERQPAPLDLQKPPGRRRTPGRLTADADRT